MSEIPKTTEKVLQFSEWLLRNEVDKLPKTNFDTMLKMFFGANHQTIFNYKKLFFDAEIISEDPNNRTLVVINKKMIETWKRNLKSLFPEWK